MSKIEELLQTGAAVIIDVRTPEEFSGGHVAGSKNIPLSEIPMHVNELKAMKNIVLCCASGGRSQNAAYYLQQQGVDCHNGGPWTSVNYLTNKK
jgi:rhodanese-related sulfurtransferase